MKIDPNNIDAQRQSTREDVSVISVHVISSITRARRSWCKPVGLPAPTFPQPLPLSCSLLTNPPPPGHSPTSHGVCGDTMNWNGAIKTCQLSASPDTQKQSIQMKSFLSQNAVKQRSDCLRTRLANGYTK